MQKQWEFDEDVAKRFHNEATSHIPDYEKVINLCLSLVQSKFGDTKNIRIIDIGSAIGHTIDVFINHGLTEIYGLEQSAHMIEHSTHKDRVFHGSLLPKPYMWDVVIANWTLHFIHDRARFIEDIASKLNPGGLLILTDKMATSKNSGCDEMYYQFKLDNGITPEEIEKKALLLQGVLNPLSLEWYIDSLTQVGFKDIAILNSRFMFNTIYARQ